MAERMKLRLLGCSCPKGSPEREYFEASVHGGDLVAASARLENEGCPAFYFGQDPQWIDGRWVLKELN